MIATAEGVIALLPQSRSLSVQLGSRTLERDLICILQDGGDVAALSESHPAPAVERALAALEDHKILFRSRAVLEVDLHSSEVGNAVAHWSGAITSLEVGGTVSLSAPLGSSLIEPWLRELRGRRIPVLLAWTAGTTVAVGLDDGRSSPCLRCALAFDSLLRDVAPGVLAKKNVLSEVNVRAVRLATGLLATMSQPSAQRPSVGCALVVDAAQWGLQWEPYGAHPACECSTQPSTAVNSCSSWEQSKARRFAPLISIDEGERDEPSRVLFRRTHRLTDFAASDYGIASASGENSRLRAFAEGVERFCMLHAPPDVRGKAATELEAPPFDEATLRAALFAPNARKVEGFRHRDFEMNLQLDWSWATAARSFVEHREAGEARRLLPTSLVGRPSPGTPSLVDTTSSGYAAHTNMPKAVALAALELIERDAVLTWWHAHAPVTKIVGKTTPQNWEAETTAYLVTQDIEVPVVLLVARLKGGGLRLTSAAATSLATAWVKAVAEMDAALWTLKRFGVRAASAPLSDPTARHGPTDHLAHYLDPGNALHVFGQLNETASESSWSQLEVRWPHADGENLTAVLDGLHTRGLSAWVVDRSLPAVFGPEWHAVRVFIPDLIEVAWGSAYARLGSPRFTAALSGGRPNLYPHPIA